MCVIDSRLHWKEHNILVTRKKLAKNVSVINRVKHLLTNDALFYPISPHLTLGNSCLPFTPAICVAGYATTLSVQHTLNQFSNNLIMLNLYDFI